MKTFRCPYCGAVLDGDAAEGHAVDCQFCRSTFVPKRKGINRSIQTVVIMVVLAVIVATVAAIAGVVNPGSVLGFLILVLLIFVIVAALWFGGRWLYNLAVWRDADMEEESVELRPPRSEGGRPPGRSRARSRRHGGEELSEDFTIPRGEPDERAKTGS